LHVFWGYEIIHVCELSSKLHPLYSKSTKPWVCTTF
jgi:hypothetical protein